MKSSALAPNAPRAEIAAPGALVGALPFVVFLLLHIARPWLIGFYDDDWSIFVEPSHFSHEDLLNYFLATFKDRPLLGVMLYGISRAWNGQPAPLVLLSSAFVAVTAWVFYVFLRRIEILAQVRSAAPALAATLWIAIPWGLGYTLWTVSSISTLSSQLCFLASAILFLDFMHRGGTWRAALGGIALLACFLIYQSFYLAFVPLLALALSFKWADVACRQRAFQAFVLCSVIQVVAVLMALSVTGKSTSINLKLIIANPVYLLPRAMGSAFSYLWIVPLLLALGFVIHGVRLMRQHGASERREYGLALGAVVMGICVGTLPFSIAGYVIQGVGTFSRTTITANLWLCTGIALVLMAASRSTPAWPRLRAISLALIGVLAAASLWQLSNWARSWERQNQILAQFPYDLVKRMDKGAVLVMDEPLYIHGVEVFSSPWDFSSAIYSSPAMIGHFAKSDRPFLVPLYRDTVVSWDGKTVLTLRPGMTVPADSVWVYTPRTGKLRQISTAGSIPADKLTPDER